MSLSQWKPLYELLKEKLGDWNLYWQIWDSRKKEEATNGSLADDIADVYRDLKQGLVLIKTEQVPPEEIIWQWRFAFYSRWGKHAIDALNTIHCLLGDHFVIDETLS